MNININYLYLDDVLCLGETIIDSCEVTAGVLIKLHQSSDNVPP